LGLASLKRKNLPIVVTLGGIGSCYASLAFYLIAFTPSYKLCDNKGSMATGLRVEDRLDGAANFGAWKERMILPVQENELWDIVENTATHPVVVPTDVNLLAAYTKKSIKAKRIILDVIKDHLIPHLTGKENAYEMWESLTKLYQSTNENRKMVLREKLKSIKMTNAENVITSY
jgi:hypothetical protein